MAKAKAQYVCRECGDVSTKWAGQCEACGSWNSIEEDTGASRSYSKTQPAASGTVLEFSSLQGDAQEAPRRETGIGELDRVFGGGIVPGSATLVGGDPGIGKSTILLQLTAQMAASGLKALYITGEESIDQVRLRAARLGVADSPVELVASTSVADILTTLAQQQPDVVIIDSIQTMYVAGIESAPGTVSQVRMAAHELITLAKHSNTAMILVGHVTKEGQIAGPKVLEHMVDTVLYFEGDRGHQFRLLRAVKNRFGAANEIGVFAMSDTGLQEVTNPSELFIGGKAGDVSGSVVFAGMEGSRPVLVEVQALVCPTAMPAPRRAVVGWDANRLAMIIAVLQRRCGLKLMDKEVYLNVAGGMRINEPAADLAVAAALISALTDVPLPEKTVVFGEIGLSGEVRPVSQAAIRLKEAAKLGFESAIVPPETNAPSKGFIIRENRYINQLNGLLNKQTDNASQVD